MKSNIPLRASRHLAGLEKAIIPKADLYRAAAHLHKLQRALDAGFRSIEEWEQAKEDETELFYQKLMEHMFPGS